MMRFYSMMSLVGERASNEEWIDGTNARWISGKLFTYGYRVVKRFIFFQAVPPSPGCLATPLMLQRGLDGPLKKLKKTSPPLVLAIHLSQFQLWPFRIVRIFQLDFDLKVCLGVCVLLKVVLYPSYTREVLALHYCKYFIYISLRYILLFII